MSRILASVRARIRVLPLTAIRLALVRWWRVRRRLAGRRLIRRGLLWRTLIRRTLVGVVRLRLIAVPRSGVLAWSLRCIPRLGGIVAVAVLGARRLAWFMRYARRWSLVVRRCRRRRACRSGGCRRWRGTFCRRLWGWCSVRRSRFFSGGGGFLGVGRGHFGRRAARCALPWLGLAFGCRLGIGAFGVVGVFIFVIRHGLSSRGAVELQEGCLCVAQKALGDRTVPTD